LKSHLQGLISGDGLFAFRSHQGAASLLTAGLGKNQRTAGLPVHGSHQGPGFLVGHLHGGGFGATPPVARNIIFSIDEGQRLFPNAIWGITATGRDMFWVGTMGLSMGCDLVRVGFEDGIHLANGKVAPSNDALVAEMVKIAAIFGRRPATVDEARESFQLKARAA